uniref:ATP-binding cassette sub-family G member 8 n=1 Tax=Diaphorina citri TaxID=121845 RepID=A0A3R5USX7_DIACI|nr:ATP-binding cassette sub-family G member 8 [Diaphorina citri]
MNTPDPTAPDQHTVPIHATCPKLSGLIRRPPIDIEFQDLTYTVPQGRSGSKIILRSVSGLFKSGELTAILGPSGAGKSTLLNVLAGYKVGNASGQILINSQPQDVKQFRKLSRYIMQEDLLQPGITVLESMMIAAHLKLGNSQTKAQKLETVTEILSMLRLLKCKRTLTSRLSGGEKKRLSIALELVDNPPVIFLDEPTTGLDDLSSSQCVSLLSMLASGGRTVICSIHTPSARLFAQFSHVYLVAEGQCMFAGLGQDVVPYLASLNIHCPRHYNPADFMIEVSSGEYGNFNEKMMLSIDNGRIYRWNKQLPLAQQHSDKEHLIKRPSQYDAVGKNVYEFDSSAWTQFYVLFLRMMLQNYREIKVVILKCVLILFMSIVTGGMFLNMAQDGSKTLFMFGFCFICTIVFMYIPMLPALLYFPQEVKLLKREYFNRWYRLRPYYLALTLSRLPQQFVLGVIYVSIAYYITDMPIEWIRIGKFSIICYLIGLTSESLGLAISSQLNVVNSVFVGPALSVPFMLLAIYGLGTGSSHIPPLIRIGMYGSYLRYGLEGIVLSLYEDRPKLRCPDSEVFCDLRHPNLLLVRVGMENCNYWLDVLALLVILTLLKLATFLILKRRLSPRTSCGALGYVGRFVKAHFSLTKGY